MTRKKLNRDEKRERRRGALSLFVRQYGRKAQKGVEPNDRWINERTKKSLKHLSPEEMDALLSDDD